MAKHNRLYFPRLILVFDTLCVLSLTVTAVVLIQLPLVILRGTGYALSVLSALLLLPCAREWLSPSYLELSGNNAIVKWNNWRLNGTVAAIDFPAKKPIRLVLKLTDAETLIDPVGPLFLLASWILYPAIRPFSSSWRAPLYPISKGQLNSMLEISPEGSLVISFVTRIYGRRRLRHVVENAVV